MGNPFFDRVPVQILAVACDGIARSFRDHIVVMQYTAIQKAFRMSLNRV